jgi:hypothetical protein
MIFFIILMKNIIPGPVTVNVNYGEKLPSPGNVKAAEAAAALASMGGKKRKSSRKYRNSSRKSRK